MLNNAIAVYKSVLVLEVNLLNKVTLDGVAAEVTPDLGGTAVSDAPPMIP